MFDIHTLTVGDFYTIVEQLINSNVQIAEEVRTGNGQVLEQWIWVDDLKRFIEKSNIINKSFTRGALIDCLIEYDYKVKKEEGIWFLKLPQTLMSKQSLFKPEVIEGAKIISARSTLYRK